MTSAPGGWKVTQTIIWKKIRPGTVKMKFGSMWEIKYSVIVRHGPNTWTQGDKKQTVVVHPDLREELRAIYEYMASCVPIARGGSAPGDTTVYQLSDASYIWKVLREQAFRVPSELLTSDDLIPELIQLINEVRLDLPLCRAAENGNGTATDLVPRRSGGEGSSVVSPASDDVPQRGGAEGSASASAASEALKKVNEGRVMDMELVSDSMMSSWTRLHTAVEAAGDQLLGVSLDPTRIPNPNPSTFHLVQRSTYQTPSMNDLRSQIEDFANAGSQTTPNPISGYRRGDVVAETEALGQPTAKRHIPRQSGARDHEKPRKRKRSLLQPTDASEHDDEEAQGSEGGPGMGEQDEEAVEQPQNLDAIADECNEVWDTCIVMGGYSFIEQEPSPELRARVTMGMWDAVEKVTENSSSDSPIAQSFCQTIKDMDSLTIRF